MKKNARRKHGGYKYDRAGRIIDGLIDKLDRQVRRLKGRLREHHHAKPEQAISGA